MSLHINARYVLLTYSQCGSLDPFRIVDALSELGAECIIGRELHSDGGTHLHAFVDFGRKFRSRRASIFDVDGYHPNISPSYGNPGEGYDYAIKDGDVVAGGLQRPTTEVQDRKKDVFAEIVLANTREEFFELCRNLAPRSLCTSFVSLEKYADWRYRVDPTPYRQSPELEFDTRQYPELNEWATTFIDRDASLGTSWRIFPYSEP